MEEGEVVAAQKGGRWARGAHLDRVRLAGADAGDAWVVVARVEVRDLEHPIPVPA